MPLDFLLIRLSMIFNSFTSIESSNLIQGYEHVGNMTVIIGINLSSSLVEYTIVIKV